MLKPTAKQRTIMLVIRQYAAENGHVPSQREIARLISTSHQSVDVQLKNLLLKGYLESNVGIARSLRLSQKGVDYLQETAAQAIASACPLSDEPLQ